MKRLLASIFFLILLLNNSKAQPITSDNYSITGIIKGIEQGTIRMYSVDENFVLDSAVISNGSFKMYGKTGLAERRRFNIQPGNWSFRAFVENSSIQMIIDTAGARHYYNEEESWALIWEIEEYGSALSGVYKRYQTETKAKEYDSIVQLLNMAEKNESDKKITGSIRKAKDSINTILRDNQKNWINNFINVQPLTVSALFLINDFYSNYRGDDILDWEPFVSKIISTDTTSIYYKELVAAISAIKNRQENKVAPDFTLHTQDKSYFNLSSSNARYRIIDFWASWCVPCRQAIPKLKTLYKKYNQHGFTIISISGDRFWNDWEKALKKEKMPWLQLIDEFTSENESSRVAGLYGIQYLPFYLLLDKEGKIVFTTGDEDLMVGKVERLFEFGNSDY